VQLLPPSERELLYYEACNMELGVLNNYLDGLQFDKSAKQHKGFPRFPLPVGSYVLVIAENQKGALKARYDQLGQVVTKFNDWSYDVVDVYTGTKTVYHAHWLRPLDHEFRQDPATDVTMNWVAAQQHQIEAILAFRFNPSSKTKSPSQLQVQVKSTDPTTPTTWQRAAELVKKVPLLFLDILPRMENTDFQAALTQLMKNFPTKNAEGTSPTAESD
jgi:hypothetical protein